MRDRLAFDCDGWRATLRSDGLYLLEAPRDGLFGIAATAAEAARKLAEACAEGLWA